MLDLEVKKENNYLRNVIKILQKKIKSLNENIEKYNKKVYSQNKEMWDRANHLIYDFDDVVEYSTYTGEIKLNRLVRQSNLDLLRKYSRMISSPYFGCVGFRLEGEQTIDKMYFGIFNLMADDSSTIYVYDWRSPVAMLYYNGRIGETSYSAPGGTIHGETRMKRQFKIVNGQIEYMFDTAVTINDEMLCYILANKADHRMKSIISSIQREQNTIIRNTTDHVLIVQGPAGSGKTSIALHRAAFLLYAIKDEIAAEDIIIFSQNDIFNSYTSDVLPELGEYDVQRLKFSKLFNSFIPEGFKINDYTEYYELLFDKNCADKIQLLASRVKTSKKFMEFLKKYVWEYKPVFCDVYLGKELVCSENFLNKLYLDKFSNMPVGNRLRRVEAYVVNTLEHSKLLHEKEINKMNIAIYYKEANLKNLLKNIEKAKKIAENICRLDVFRLYLSATKQYIVEKSLPKEIYEFTQRNLDSKRLSFDDATILIYLRLISGDIKSEKNVRHVILDEAQDYNYMLHYIVKNLFSKSSFTILGDVNQSIHSDTAIIDLGQLVEVYNGAGDSYVEIENSYRSTLQINLFAECLSSSQIKAVYFERKGQPVEIILAKDMGHTTGKLISEIQGEHGNDVSIAIITKYKKVARDLYNVLLTDGILVKIIDDPGVDLVKGAIIMPVYLTKGLEFDHVIVHNVSDENYYTDLDKRVLYLASTRAIHSLRLVYSGALSRHLKNLENVANYR